MCYWGSRSCSRNRILSSLIFSAGAGMNTLVLRSRFLQVSRRPSRPRYELLPHLRKKFAAWFFAAPKHRDGPTTFCRRCDKRLHGGESDLRRVMVFVARPMWFLAILACASQSLALGEPSLKAVGLRCEYL